MYFKYFPKTMYSYTKAGKKEFTAVTDIFRRVIVNQFIPDASRLRKHYVGDGDTPEILSHKLYGTTDYHWVILLINNIVDVNKEWPLAQEDLVIYCEDKYGVNNIKDVHHYVLASDNTIIVDWDAGLVSNGTYKEVTNFEYEENLNEEKRQILVLGSEYIFSIKSQFKKLIK